MPDLSVVIVSIKDKEDILCVSKFEESGFDDYELIIRDDEGIARARNEGIKQANGEKIVFIDDDAQPLDGYLQAATSVLEQESVVAGRVIHPGDGIISKFASHYPTDTEAKYVSEVVGCNMAFRREVFEQVGLFDEKFSWGHEDVDFIDRVKKHYPVYYEPNMGVVHSYADDIFDYWKKQYQFGSADVYYAKKKGKTNIDIIKGVFNPLWYYSPGLRTLPISIVGGICRCISQIQNIQKE